MESKHGHLLDTSRAIRFQADFPKQFQGECIIAATHIVNKLPMANLNWKNPFEMLYGQAPNIKDLITVDYLCYATKIGETDKFEPRAWKCVLLGYTFGFNGYELYDLQSTKVFHSRYVIFKEQVFLLRESFTVHQHLTMRHPLFGPIQLHQVQLSPLEHILYSLFRPQDHSFSHYQRKAHQIIMQSRIQHL